MFTHTVIASYSHSAQVENLRSIAYHNSTGFKVINEDVFEKYCRWCEKDDTGIVLLLLNENGDAISTLRGNVYFDSAEHEASNPSFAGHTGNFVKYPVLDMTFAATAPNYYNGGFLSVLRYYMYFLHRHTVKSISGQVVKESVLFHTLQHLGYNFKEIAKTQPSFDKATKAVDKWMLAILDSKKFDWAIEILRTKYSETIKQYPLIIS